MAIAVVQQVSGVGTTSGTITFPSALSAGNQLALMFTGDVRKNISGSPSGVLGLFEGNGASLASTAVFTGSINISAGAFIFFANVFVGATTANWTWSGQSSTAWTAWELSGGTFTNTTVEGTIGLGSPVAMNFHGESGPASFDSGQTMWFVAVDDFNPADGTLDPVTSVSPTMTLENSHTYTGPGSPRYYGAHYTYTQSVAEQYDPLIVHVTHAAEQHRGGLIAVGYRPTGGTNIQLAFGNTVGFIQQKSNNVVSNTTITVTPDATTLAGTLLVATVAAYKNGTFPGAFQVNVPEGWDRADQNTLLRTRTGQSYYLTTLYRRVSTPVTSVTFTTTEACDLGVVFQEWGTLGGAYRDPAIWRRQVQHESTALATTSVIGGDPLGRAAAFLPPLIKVEDLAALGTNDRYLRHRAFIVDGNELTARGWSASASAQEMILPIGTSNASMLVLAGMTTPNSFEKRWFLKEQSRKPHNISNALFSVFFLDSTGDAELPLAGGGYLSPTARHFRFVNLPYEAHNAMLKRRGRRA